MTESESLDRDPVVLVYDVARIMRTKFDQRARASGMTRALWHILARVEHNPGVSQRELAAICEVEPITVGRLVDRLEERGLIERRRDPSDRRIWRLHNLPPARPMLEEINAYREELIQGIDAIVGRDALEAMADALVAIRAHLTAAPESAAEAAAEAATDDADSEQGDAADQPLGTGQARTAGQSTTPVGDAAQMQAGRH